MKNIRSTAFLLILIVLLSSLCGWQVSAEIDVTPASCYWYNEKGEAVTLPDVYSLEQNIDLQAYTTGRLLGIQDAFVAGDGNIYILDMSGIVLILDSSFQLVRCIESFTLDGAEELLNAPEGLFVDENGVMYIADTQNFRIIKAKDGLIQQIFERPENLTGTVEEIDYLPSKIVVDSAGRMFVVVRNVGMGIVVLDKTGRFISYRGAPSVKLSLYDMFWRRFSTSEQLDRMTTYVPTEYNNIAIDENDFLFGTISSISEEDMAATIKSNDFSTDVTPIKKLNLAGEDILRRKGLYPPVGDLTVDSLSSFVDVALTDCGIYTVLDSSKGRLFTYNDDGELLFVFGGIGDHHDSFAKPVAVSYSGDRLLVFDEKLNRIFCFEPTVYGNYVINASKYYYNGAYEQSNDCWREVLNYNSNLTLAYVGVGKAYYQEKKYDEAMECFQIAGDVKNYSLAFSHQRDAFIRANFRYFIIVLLVVVGIAVVVSAIKRFRRYCRS